MVLGFLIKEGIHSVAMEHESGCVCRICRAANGDTEAFMEVTIEVLQRLEGKGY